MKDKHKEECRYSDSIPRMEEKLNQIHAILTGNGTPGLIRQVHANTKNRYILYGITITITSALFIMWITMFMKG